MAFIKEFREFALKGNLVDIAVAFVMGAAFGRVITAFTEGIVSPLIGLLLGGFDLSKKVTVLKAGMPEIKDATGKIISPAITEVSVKWGAFINNIIDFLIVALVMFIIIKAINNAKKKKELVVPSSPEYSLQEKLLMEIRDSLKK